VLPSENIQNTPQQRDTSGLTCILILWAREEPDNLTNAGQTACSSMHHSLPTSFAERLDKRITEDGGAADEVAEPPNLYIRWEILYPVA